MAVNAREQALVDAVDSMAPDMVSRIQELVAIPTVNPYSGDASAASEAPGQEWMAARLNAMGADVRRIPVPPNVYEQAGMLGPEGRTWEGRENVIGEWTLGDGSGPTILINDHMDTVGASEMAIAPFDPVIKDGKMYGRGASDTKGNIMMGLTAIEGLLQHAGRLNGRVIFESVVDEECNGGGAGSLACCLAGVAGDFAICLDGQRDGVHVGCNGISTAAVTVYGQAGHSSAGHSVNAIDKGIQVKEAIDAFGAAHNAANPSCLVTVGIFRSGTLPAVVPGEAELQMNLSYPAEDAAQAERERGKWDGAVFRDRFAKALSTLGEQNSWFKDKPVKIDWIKDLIPFATDVEHPYVQTALGATREFFGADCPTKTLPAWFDAAHLARRLGVPTVGMGCGTLGQAHGPTEYVVLADLVSGAKALALALHRLLGPAA